MFNDIINDIITQIKFITDKSITQILFSKGTYDI